MNNLIPFDEVKLTGKDILLSDTSFLLSFLGHDDVSTSNGFFAREDLITRKKECQRLVETVFYSDAVFAISVQTQKELNSVLINSEFKRQGYYRGEEDIKRLKELDPDKHSRIIQDATAMSKEYLKNILSQDIFNPEIIGCIDSGLINAAQKIMYDFNIHSTGDAIQIAIALRENIPYFVTTDKDFNSISLDNLKILVDRATYNKRQE